MESPILVTGSTGTVGRVVCKLLLERGHKVRALVRAEDPRSAKLRNSGAEVVVGDLLDLRRDEKTL